MTRDELVEKMARAICHIEASHCDGCGQACERLRQCMGDTVPNGPIDSARAALAVIESIIPVGAILSGEAVVDAAPKDIEQNERQRLAIAMLADARAARKRNRRRGR